jgi:hypothetical protein
MPIQIEAGTRIQILRGNRAMDVPKGAHADVKSIAGKPWNIGDGTGVNTIQVEQYYGRSA